MRAHPLGAFVAARPHACLIGLALLLSSGALWLEPAADDHLLQLALDPDVQIRGLSRAPWDLFAFAKDATTSSQLMDAGVFPWWSDPNTRISFFRPLSSLSAWLDQQLWPGRPALMHLHSLLWFAALLIVVSAVYRRCCRAPRVAGLALAVFALDDARAYTLGWLCNRNALIALVFGCSALLAHERWRRHGARGAGWLAPVLLALGLLAGETALQAVAYIVAYALFLDRGTPMSRAASMLPCTCVLAAWGLAYSALGYGASGSGLYVDPARDPLGFAAAVAERLPVLLAAQYAGLIAELVDALPVVAPAFARLFVLLCAALVAVVFALLRPLLRHDRELAFWLFGSVLATVPVCGVSPTDRVLTATALGGSAAIATLLVSFAERTYPLLHRAWARLAGAALAVIHLVFSPLLLPVRISGVDRMEELLAEADGSLSSRPETAERTLVLINPPLDPFAVFFPLYRAAHGIQRPRRFRWLTTGVSELRLERVDASTLRVTPHAGFLSNSTQWMLRDPRRNPMREGQVVPLTGVQFEIESLNVERLPAAVLVRFDRPLEHASFEWKQWGTNGYVPFVPPAIGQGVTLPAVDMVRTIL